MFWLAIKLGIWPSASGIIAGGVAMVFVWFLSRGMTSPLREMAAAASAMAQGDYSRRVPATSQRRGRAHSPRAFNKMSAELGETDRVRRDLVANVSHELRTPITALQAKLENLVDGVEAPDRETFETMLAQVERLGRLVQQLLDLSRLEAGVVPLERAAFPVEPLLEHAVREQRLHAPSVDVAVNVEPANLTADGDPERVHQVVANLLENAVRFTPDGRHGRGAGEPKPDRGHRSKSSTKAPASPNRIGRASSSASTAPTRRGPRRPAEPASGSPSPAGSSTSTAATSIPSGETLRAAAWWSPCRRSGTPKPPRVERV